MCGPKLFSISNKATGNLCSETNLCSFGAGFSQTYNTCTRVSGKWLSHHFAAEISAFMGRQLCDEVVLSQAQMLSFSLSPYNGLI